MKHYRKSGINLFGVAGGLLAVTQAFAAQTPNLAALGSFEVPAPGEHVVLDAAFLSPEDDLVLQVDVLDNDALSVNFYDVQARSWLLEQPLTTKDDIAITQHQLTDNGYEALPHIPTIELPNGTQAFNTIHLQDMCFRPYSDFLTIQQPNQPPAARAIYIRRAMPVAIPSSEDPATPPLPQAEAHSCKDASGNNLPLTARYRQESAFYMPDNASGFFALIGRYVIHFDGDGNTNFFSGSNNPILLSVDDTNQIQSMLTDTDANDTAQDAVDQAETLIDQRAQSQAAESAQ